MHKGRVFPANRAAAMGFALLVALAAGAPAQTLPPGFRDKVLGLGGLNFPTAIAFSPDGRVFVAEKRGLIRVYSSLSATTPTTFADLRSRVYNYWDRGLLGLALHPNFPATPYVYVLYAYDGDIGGPFPKWGPGDGNSDPCPTPPGPTTDGCTVSGRLSRLTANGNVWDGTEQVLIHDWFQQFPSHSIGTLMFGNDGALYASGGEGASFNWADYGQAGNPKNPGGDPPVGVGGTQTPPTAEGGALRSQDLRTSGDPVTLDGSVIRIDPTTGAGMPDNPLAGDPDANARRIIAYGLRNPFRITARPGSNEIWVGDVGYNTWEEINRINSPQTMQNFGWPCYEGVGQQSSYANLPVNICTSLYSQPGAVTPPVFTYNHSAKIVPGETCTTGSSSVTGLAFYTGTSYPAAYQNALFFGDYSRQCIWTMFPDANGNPDPTNVQNFVSGAPSPVQLITGPGGDLFYVDVNAYKIHRIQYFVPNAVISATPTTGSAPLTVNFDGSGSTDPDPTDTLSYSWDLNGDGVFGDATTAQTSYTFTTPGVYTVTLKVTDTHGGTDTEQVAIEVDNSAPVATISAPLSTLTWKVGDTIAFAGSATDAQDGPLSNASLSWTLLIHHCPSDCHLHTVQTYDGVASGSFAAPDHEYPSYLELKLTATDSLGLQGSTSVTLYPQTVPIALATNPSGLQLSWDSISGAAPINTTVIIGSQNTVSAPSPQILNGSTYEFLSWSDAGAASHNVVAPATAPPPYTATFVLQPPPSSLSASPGTVVGGGGSTGTVTLSGPAPPSGAIVALSSANAPVASVPSSITVLPGALSTTFPITTTAVSSDTSVTLTAFYGGGNVSTSLTVTRPPNVPPSVSITSPSAGATFTAPASITIQATASDSDGSVARVDFYQGTTLLGSATPPAALSYAWNGVAAGSYSLTAVATDNLGATTTSTPVAVTVNNPSSGLPAPWFNQDVGSVNKPGSATYSGGAFTAKGSGSDISGTADSFQFVDQLLTGDGQIVARVASVQNTNTWAKAGVMFRETLAANSTEAMMLVNPVGTASFQRRTTTGGTTTATNTTGAATPYWVKLVRSGNTFTAFTSPDGATWTLLGSSTFAMSSSTYVGLAVTSHSVGVLCSAVFDNVSVTPAGVNSPPTVSITSPANGSVYASPASIAIQATASDSDGTIARVDFYQGATLLGSAIPPAPIAYTWNGVAVGNYSLTAVAVDNSGAATTSAAVGVTVSAPSTALPSPWVNVDVGAVGKAGGATFTGGVFTVKGAGADISGTADAFQFVYQPLSGDGQIVARISSVQNTNSWAKAGVMIRETLATNSTEAMMLLNPVGTASFQRRTTTGGTTTASNATGAATPYWVKLVRTGNTFTGFASPDGSSWSLVGTASIPMAANVSVGLGVTSHSTTTLCSATIDNVSFVATPPDAPPSVTLTSPSNGTTFGAGSTIALSATATDSDGTVAHVDFYSGTTLLASISSPPYAYNWVGVGPGTYTLTATATDNLGGIATSPTVTINVSNLPSPWSEGDVGSPSPIGSSSYSNGTFTVKGSGTDISGTSDQFHFVYQAWNGDGQVTARVASVQNTNAWAKAGVMIRETLAANATEAMILITPSGKASFQRRTATAGATSATNVTGPTAPYWVRLVRTGNTLTAFVSPDGVSWSLVDTATVPMATNVSVGMAVSSHVSTLLCTSVFTDVTVTTP